MSPHGSRGGSSPGEGTVPHEGAALGRQTERPREVGWCARRLQTPETRVQTEIRRLPGMAHVDGLGMSVVTRGGAGPVFEGGRSTAWVEVRCLFVRGIPYAARSRGTYGVTERLSPATA